MTFSGPPLHQPIDVFGLLRPALAVAPDDVAVVSATARRSWRELDDESTRLALNLLGLGLRPGDRVASLMPNVPALVVHYLACVKGGLVATPLNYRYTAPEIDHALAVSGAAALVVHAERRSDVAASNGVPRLAVGVIWYGNDREGKPTLEQLAAREIDSGRLPAVDPSLPAFVFFTSGSTGAPKGVTHSYDSLGWIAASTRAVLEYERGDRFLVASSLSHEGGVGFSFAALGAGVRIVVPRTVDPDEVLPLVREHRPTVAWTLPPLLTALVRDERATTEDFDSLRMCMTGGDQAPAQLAREFEALTGFTIHETYGLTECGNVATNPRHGVNKQGSIGPLTPGYEGTIRGDDGEERPPGEEGRLWVRSPANMIGYWHDRDATAEVFDGAGWFDTGDVMTVDGDGYLWFRGRSKQIIVRDGSNISPQEVEGALMEHPAVGSVGVVGIADAVHGEAVCAYVVLRDGTAMPSTRELIRFAAQRVGYKAPSEIVLIDALPLSPSGKVDRTALANSAAARRGGRRPPAATDG